MMAINSLSMSGDEVSRCVVTIPAELVLARCVFVGGVFDGRRSSFGVDIPS